MTKHYLLTNERMITNETLKNVIKKDAKFNEMRFMRCESKNTILFDTVFLLHEWLELPLSLSLFLAL